MTIYHLVHRTVTDEIHISSYPTVVEASMRLEAFVKQVKKSCPSLGYIVASLGDITTSVEIIQYSEDGVASKVIEKINLIAGEL